MDRIIGVLQTVLPVLVMLGIGMLCRKKALISREGVNALKNVVVNITLPAVLLSAFATTQYTFMDIVIPLLMFLICLAGWVLGKAAMKLFRMPSRFVLFVFTLYKILLGLESSKKADPKELIREMVFSPIIIAIAAGVLLGATGLYRALAPSGISGLFDACTDFVSAPTGAIILLTIGYDLVLTDVPWASTGKVVAVRFGIMMILRLVLLFVLRLILPSANLTGAINVMFILPPPFVLPVFADDADQRVYVSSALSVSTLVAIAGFAILAAAG